MSPFLQWSDYPNLLSKPRPLRMDLLSLTSDTIRATSVLGRNPECSSFPSPYHTGFSPHWETRLIFALLFPAVSYSYANLEPSRWSPKGRPQPASGLKDWLEIHALTICLGVTFQVLWDDSSSWQQCLISFNLVALWNRALGSWHLFS